MKIGERSLRVLVEKWLGLDCLGRARVTRLRSPRQHALRCVRVEDARASGALAIPFFRHDDGSWCVFPPEGQRPALNAGGSPVMVAAGPG
jgi:hypothetical protein